MKYEYDFANTEQSKLCRPINALELSTDFYGFEVSTIDEVSSRILKAEENADYVEHEFFWKAIDNQCLTKQI